MSVVKGKQQKATTEIAHANQPFTPSTSSGQAFFLIPYELVVVLAAAPLGVFEFVLPLFGSALGTSTTTIGWLFSVFALTALTLRPIVGALLDLGRRGERRWWVPSPTGLLACGLVTYAISMALFATATSVGMLVVARLVQGIASSITWLTINVVFADRSDSKERARMFGRLTSLIVVGSGLGAAWTVIVVGLFDATTRTQVTQLLPGLAQSSGLPFDKLVFPMATLDSVATLHLVFWGYVGFVLVALVVLMRSSRQSAVGSRQPAVGSHPITSRFTFHVSHLAPLLPLLIASMLRSSGYGLTLPVLTVYLNQRFGAGLVGVGLAFALPGIVYAVAPGPLGRLADRIGHQRAAVIGLLTSVITYGLLPLIPSLWLLIPLWGLEAICFCLVGPALLALLTDRAVPELRGQAFALYTLAGGVGSALTPALGGWLYDRFGAAWPFWGNGLFVALAALVVGGAFIAHNKSFIVEHAQN